MRLYRYVRAGDDSARLALDVGDGLIDLQDAWSSAGAGEVYPSALTSTASFIGAGPEHWQRAVGAVEGVTSGPLEAPRLLCPFDRIASLRDFLAFEDHVIRGAKRRDGNVPDYWYEAPIYYKGNHRSLVGPDEDVAWPSYTEKLDFETELAMVVAAGGRNVARDAAPEFIFGFTVFNDFSARDVQMQETGAWLGPAKGKDFANAFGPCIVTADEVGFEPDLEMICRVNGQEWGRGRSGAIRWKWADMIAHVSRDEDIYPVDVYGSGTPGGCCGLDLDRWIKPGDVVEIAIERIGVLRNRVVR